MIKIDPATDEEIDNLLKQVQPMASVQSLIARIRQEQRRAEAAEKVVEAADLFSRGGTTVTICNRGACQRVVEYKDKTDPQYQMFRALHAFSAAKAKDFKEGT